MKQWWIEKKVVVLEKESAWTVESSDELRRGKRKGTVCSEDGGDSVGFVRRRVYGEVMTCAQRGDKVR